ncbi:MAG: tryptophan synthase subunit alpha [Cycloclasticus sp.]|nr:tryptophan synthase subunit alpha [Cycloclasticus sp.]MBQ0789274.1 tryptophan synthase subunit alpha [Cycloclasticus sp.]
MNRLDDCFKALKKVGKKALIPFVTAGDPNADFTLSCMHAMAKSGADIIELGVPFSDPMADGPVIQKASERALKGGMTLRGVIALVKRFRQQDKQTPVVLMGYLNPIEFMGYEAFAASASEAGVDGVLTVDIPPEESAELVAAYEKHGISPVFLLAPTSLPHRIKKVVALAKGYIYYVSLKGVTGTGSFDLDDVANKIEEIKQFTSLPLAVGFGVKNADLAANIAKIGDAVVVGSALIDCITANADDYEQAQAAISSLVNDMRIGMDAVS